jgi:hypothetical protein
MTPRPQPSPAASLDDRCIIDLLTDLRERAAAGETDPQHVESAIAELEAEAARRGLELPSVEEMIPAGLAFCRFEAAFARNDVPAMANAISYCDAAGMWRAYRRIRVHDDAPTRMYLLQQVFLCVAWTLYGEQWARERWSRFTAATQLDDTEYEAYLVQCIDSLFTVSIINMNLPY